ncbi:uncharacterized protein LOC128276053 [Anopheles cruzii]|uniref:uncharacterized protein LOC128276053 n=1 Tax=Anopheles cruzii TaxID=68878 RepID=UPI0022EC87BF|nr:uncharacterized protein LOC128276053 [Anopheles cruzii]
MTSFSSVSQELKESARGSFEERVNNLRTAYRDVLEQGFFRNLQHDWLHRTAGAEPDLQPAAASDATLDPGSDASGSFIVLNGRKFPLAFFRNKNTAAEQQEEETIVHGPTETDRTAPAAANDDYANPYAVPTRRDRNVNRSRFHTARSRAWQDVPERLHVAELPFEAELLGTTRRKQHPSRLATQLDAHYRNELTHRSRIRRFLRTSAIAELRESCRRRLESFYHREYILAQAAKREQEAECYRQLAERCAELRQAMGIIRQERFSATMRVLDTMKPYFETSAQLERHLRGLRRRMTSLWNHVVHLESVWVRRLKLQNFQYLIMPKEWRERYDWIHQDATTGRLESFPESIARRDVVNLRDIAEGNDIWAVKRFYEEQYLAKDKPIHAAFPSSGALMAGVAELNTNSLTLLSRLDLMNWVKTNAEMESADAQRMLAQKIRSIRRFIQDTAERRQFHRKRSIELRQLFLQLADGPLKDCVQSERTREIESLVTVAYGKLLPADQRHTETSGSVALSAGVCFGFIFDIALRLLADFDRLPADRSRRIEQQVRFRRRLLLRQATRAADEQHRIGQLAVQLGRSLAPRPPKPDGKVKPRRSRLHRKEVPVMVPKPKVPKLDVIFRMAFGDGATMTPDERRHYEIDMIYQNFCSVQFDHFLRTIGYEPDYELVSEVERRDGPEESFFRQTELIPTVMKRLRLWQQMQALLRQRLIKRISQDLQAVGGT